MDRRKFCTSVAALGTSAVLPAVATAEEAKTGNAKSSGADSASNLRLAMLSDETTRQFTTFNLSRKSKTIPVPRGKRVTIGGGEGQGYIAQFWLTFPGWFWQ